MDAGDDQTGMRDHMDAGDAGRCKLKILYENSWVPQKCGNRKQVPQVPQCGIKCGTMCGNMLLSFLDFINKLPLETSLVWV